jgi:hypothetical protein
MPSRIATSPFANNASPHNQFHSNNAHYPLGLLPAPSPPSCQNLPRAVTSTMEHNTMTFGRSVSMPLLQQESEERNPQFSSGVANEGQYRALQHSPGFQVYRNQAADIWSPNGNGFASPFAPVNENPIRDASSKSKSPASQMPMRSAFSMKGTSLTQYHPLRYTELQRGRCTRTNRQPKIDILKCYSS